MVVYVYVYVIWCVKVELIMWKEERNLNNVVLYLLSNFSFGLLIEILRWLD